VTASVTTLSASDVAAAGIEDTLDLGGYGPSPAVQEGGDCKLSFLHSEHPERDPRRAGGWPLCGGVPYTNVRAALIELLDVDHIDVFAGRISSASDAAPRAARSPHVRIAAFARNLDDSFTFRSASRAGRAATTS
jgi:hypothetical protein